MKIYILIILSAVLYAACHHDDTNTGITPEVSFSDFTDTRDTVAYRCITIGEQTWMAENLRYRIPNGSWDGCYTLDEADVEYQDLKSNAAIYADSVKAAIHSGRISNPDNWTGTGKSPVEMLQGYAENKLPPTLFISYAENANLTAIYNTLKTIDDQVKLLAIPNVAAAKMKKAEESNGNYAREYGFLYTYAAARQAVPEGWRLPTDDDWKELEKNLGMKILSIDQIEEWRGEQQGKLLKDKSQGIGFRAQLGGSRVYGITPSGTPYFDQDYYGYYWSDTMSDDPHLGIIRKFAHNKEQIFRGSSKLTAAYSVRCIKK